MGTDFKYDIFLSHSSHDKDVVRDIANRLKSDGVRVWFDDWEIRPGDSIPAKIEDGLEQSRVLVLCMSAEALAGDWPRLESYTFRFKDPLNHKRRFIPLKLDEAPVKGSLAQFSYIDWRPEQRNKEYPLLLLTILDGIQKQPQLVVPDIFTRTFGSHHNRVLSVCPTKDSRTVFSSSIDSQICQWNLEDGSLIRKYEGHSLAVNSLAVSKSEDELFSASSDGSVRIWDIATGNCKAILPVVKPVNAICEHPNQKLLAIGTDDGYVETWSLLSHKRQLSELVHDWYIAFWALKYSPDGAFLVSGSGDKLIGIKQFEKPWIGLHAHSSYVFSVVFSPDGNTFFTASDDTTIRIWNVRKKKCTNILEGHTSQVLGLAISSSGHWLVSSSEDATVKFWDLRTLKCLKTHELKRGFVLGVAFTPDDRKVIGGTSNGEIIVWDFARIAKTMTLDINQQKVFYTNAKVLLVGNSAVGKTGLSNRLALDTYKKTDSTVGAWATQWKLPLPEGDDVAGDSSRRSDEDSLWQDATATNVEREVWLWDFGGQADQRLIHQLYMDQTQVAALVFDPQKDDVFETLGQWDRDLSRADKDKPDNDQMTKLLVAGRCDAGGLRVAKSQLESFVEERGYAGYYPTSAKKNEGCKELKQAIIDGIKWENIPWRSSPVLFKRLKDEIIKLKDDGRVLLRFNELREVLSLQMQGKDTKFTDAELKAVVGLLAGPGVVWELEFGSWVLLQPERINAYAQAVIQTVREDEFDRGCISEQRVLDGNLTYHSSAERLPKDEEQFVLLAMHQILVKRGLCIRHQAESGEMLLIFPSYYRRERQEPNRTPAVQVSYTFNGFLDEIYATLVVKLHHTREFTHDNLWRNAADFKTQAGEKSLGLRMIRKPKGEGELQAFFAEDMPVADKIIFSKYIHEHLLQSGNDVQRFRHYVCQNEYRGNPCGTTANRDVAMERLEERGECAELRCQRCDAKMHLWDELEERFADDDIRQRVQGLRDAVKIKLDTESKERVLVGEVISTVALAGQICREIQVSDWGIDAEVEFKSDEGQATAKKAYLQLKSGDSFLHTRKRDKAQIFKSFNKRQAEYWMAHEFPVMLVIRNSKGEIQWMDIRDELRRVTNNGKKQVRQIEFDGQRFDVMSVRRWRANALGLKHV